MTRLDFGKQCNLVWKSKYTQLLNAHRVKGSDEYNWSFPITEEGKLLAKFRNGAQYLPRLRKRQDQALKEEYGNRRDTL